MYSAAHPTITALLTAWHEAGRAGYCAHYPALASTYDTSETKRATDRRRFIALDEGSSGAFLVEKASGNVYGIKGYGVPHMGKRYGHVETLTGDDLQRLCGHSYYRGKPPVWPAMQPEVALAAPVVLPFPHPTVPERKTIDLLTTAKMLKAELVQRFPGVKFSVTSERYSMGCSIDVSWQDGPSQAQVAPIFAHFQGERFDGSDDSRHMVLTEHAGERVHFAADHVHGARSFSVAFLQQIVARVCHEHGITSMPVVQVSHGHALLAPGAAQQ